MKQNEHNHDQYELATFGGGCFWCTEAIFKRIKGVISIKPGYAGGVIVNPTYNQVSTGKTGYVESIQIKFDSQIISFAHLLDIFWATHDPTTLNRQGADIGTQYASVIFYHTQEQKESAEKSKSDLEESGKLKDKIVTRIIPFKNFYPAESYHQNYYENFKNTNAYCSLVIDPKIDKLIKQFNDDLKEEYK
ncbi:peptide-methionine (S)-S-oxide reductase MsrA [Patescibacteria group bacterium]|nr:peptide-methionine (S)-S-oxide reductase MsrA [Patescibacteria group bacterium]